MRCPVLLISLFGSAIGYLIFGIGGALWVLFVSRLIDGITAGNQSVAAAYIADVSAPNARAKNFTLIGMAWGIGLVVAASGAALGQWRLDAPAFVAAGLSLLGAMLGLIWLPESLLAAQRQTTPLRLADLNPFGAMIAFARKPGLGKLLLALCLFNMAFQGINSTETLFLIERFAAQPWQIGALLVAAGGMIVVVQRMVAPLVARYGERGIAGASLFLLALGALATCLAPALWLVFPIGAVRNIMSALVFPTVGGLMSSQVTPREQGSLMGINTALASLMSILGPLLAGAVYDSLMPSAPYWIGAIVFVLAAGLLVRAPTRETASAPR